MEIKKYNYNRYNGLQSTLPSFKGYDARKLTGLFVTDKTCAEALKRLSAKTGIDIFTPNIATVTLEIFSHAIKIYATIKIVEENINACDCI